MQVLIGFILLFSSILVACLDILIINALFKKCISCDSTTVTLLKPLPNQYYYGGKEKKNFGIKLSAVLCLALRYAKSEKKPSSPY